MKAENMKIMKLISHLYERNRGKHDIINSDETR